MYCQLSLIYNLLNVSFKGTVSPLEQYDLVSVKLENFKFIAFC